MAKISTSHILVKYEHEAVDVLRKLDEGVSFEELAQKYSQCPSARQGGRLGAIETAHLDEDYCEAALALKPGMMSIKPVRTKFGYHLIRRDG